MATSYTVHFKNSTNNAYHFAIYQKYPNSPGLESVAWQVRGLGPGATNRVDWTLDYQVAIADWDANAGLYSGCQVVPADLGKVYEVVTLEGDIPVINKTPIKTTDDGLIKLHNNTSPAKAVTLGFAMTRIGGRRKKYAGRRVCGDQRPSPVLRCLLPSYQEGAACQ